MSELRGGSTVGGYSILHKGNPSELLDSLKTVDGVGSGLDADLLDGMAPATTNTASTIVQRDASGNFSAGTITATLSGNATTASSWEIARTITLGGDLTGSVSVKGDANVTLTATVTDNSHNHGNATITDVDWSKVSNKPDPVITLTGDVTGSGTMTDVGSVSITTTVADSSHNHAWSNITSGTPTTLSGYGITDAVKMASVSYTTPATAQWYRIAQSAVYIGRNAAIFEVEWTASGVHGFARFSATCMYGTTASSGVDQISYGIFSTNGITKARVVYHTTYAANYAYLEIYLNIATATTLSIKANDSTGWTLITPIAGSIPAGYSSKEITFKAGVGTTDQIFSDVATGTAPLVVTSTTKVANLNADLLDDLSVATTATANTIVARDANGYIYTAALNSTLADTATAATHYYVETGSDGWLRPKTLANVKTEIVTKAAVEAALTGAITTHNHSYLPLSGGTLTGDLNVLEIKEGVSLIAAPFTGNYNIDLSFYGVFYSTVDANSNFGLNFRADASTPLNAFLNVGQSISFTIMIKNGATAFMPNAFFLDGNSITPKWLGGTAPTAGDANTINIYSFTIIKTSSAPTFTLLASKSKFA